VLGAVLPAQPASGLHHHAEARVHQGPRAARVQLRTGEPQLLLPHGDVLPLREDHRAPQGVRQPRQFRLGDAVELGVLEAVGHVGRRERHHGVVRIAHPAQAALDALREQSRRLQAGRRQDVDLARVVPVERRGGQSHRPGDVPVGDAGEPVAREERNGGGEDLRPPGARHRGGQFDVPHSFRHRRGIGGGHPQGGGDQQVLGAAPGDGDVVRRDGSDRAERGHGPQPPVRERVLPLHRLVDPLDEVDELRAQPPPVGALQVPRLPPVQAARAAVFHGDPRGGGQHLGGRRPRRDLVHRGDQPVRHDVGAGGEQGVLVGEVPVERGSGDPHRGGDLLHRRRVIAAPAEDPAGRLDDELLAVAGSDRGGRTRGHGRAGGAQRPVRKEDMTM
jgi:hypothetical protein